MTALGDSHSEDMSPCKVRDTRFGKIHTNRGYIDFTMHTDHNGCYGGFYFVKSVEIK